MVKNIISKMAIIFSLYLVCLPFQTCPL